jgi:hypothetical protein
MINQVNRANTFEVQASQGTDRVESTRHSMSEPLAHSIADHAQAGSVVKSAHRVGAGIGRSMRLAPNRRL